jgi:NADH-quinone oxidoreductase subunit M
MILVWLIAIPFLGGLLALCLDRVGGKWVRSVCLVALIVDFFLACLMWAAHIDQWAGPMNDGWFAEVRYGWLPRFGITFHLAMDGISLLLVMLTLFLGACAVAASWTEIEERTGCFHFTLMASLSGIMGVFLAMDLFLFYFFWELMLVPVYFLIAMWGHENRVYAAVKFFIFTQLGGLLMLTAILALFFLHGRQTGVYSFDYADLLGTAMDPSTAMLLMLGFFIAFAVKLPAIPLHTWLPDAHTEAPTAGSIILAGLLLKTGAYGLIRFAVPLFPGAAAQFAPPAMLLAVIGIIYGGVLAFAQTDLKRLVAYTSISHMGFVLLGIFAWNLIALEGAVVQMVCHGVSTGALFLLAGALEGRIHTRELAGLGGLWTCAPRFGGTLMFFALASLGLPGLGNFVGEFLVLLGTYEVRPVLAAAGTAGFVISTAYSLRLVRDVAFGPVNRDHTFTFRDLSFREIVALGAMMAAILWIGIYPGPVIRAAGQGLGNTDGLFQDVGVPEGDEEEGEVVLASSATSHVRFIIFPRPLPGRTISSGAFPDVRGRGGHAGG